jgi:phage tail-like protein
MADAPTTEIVLPPLTAFNFRVELYLEEPGGPGGGADSANQRRPLCSAAFAECDGLEMTLAPKTIREGGNNNQPVHLIGPVSYGQLSLKRGLTDTLELWNWFDQVTQPGRGGLRAFGEVVLLSSERRRAGAGGELLPVERLRFKLTGCLPVKLKAPALNAKDGLVAVEEMQIAYERLRVERVEG